MAHLHFKLTAMGKCFFPLRIYNVKDRRGEQVPCGKCYQCFRTRVSQWSVRLLQEEKVSISSSFITLTYDTDFVPFTSTGRKTIDKRDLQLFFKRLRKAHKSPNRRSIKYYAVGEYGTLRSRPHYHVLLFNADLELVEKAWGLGNVDFGKIENASVGYTLKYIMKKGTKFSAGDRAPEFSLMSKGLGLSYLTDRMISWHHADMDGRMYVNVDGGKKVALPRYYRQRLLESMKLSKKELPFYLDILRLSVSDEMIRLHQLELLEHGSRYHRDKSEAAWAAYRKFEYDLSHNAKF